MSEDSARIAAEGMSEMANELARFLAPSRFGPFLPDRWQHVRGLVAEVFGALSGFDGAASPELNLEEVRVALSELQRALGDGGVPSDQIALRTAAERFVSAVGFDHLLASDGG
jgi:hypothetical protein